MERAPRPARSAHGRSDAACESRRTFRDAGPRAERDPRHRPDVGGGFGYKGILLPEEVCLGWLARRLMRPVRWIEDRREQLIANANCREHDYDLTLYADREGR